VAAVEPAREQGQAPAREPALERVMAREQELEQVPTMPGRSSQSN
jgi:hypothetical protein